MIENLRPLIYSNLNYSLFHEHRPADTRTYCRQSTLGSDNLRPSTAELLLGPI